MMQFSSLIIYRSSASLILAILSMVAASLYSIGTSAQAAELLVLYPDVRAPFSKVFNDISSGAEKYFDGGSSSKAIAKGDSAKKLLLRKNPDVVLVLGKRSLASLQGVESKIPVVLGAMSNQQYDYPGISMIPDPKVILDRLMLLSPAVGQVHVVKKSKGSDLQLDGASKYLISSGKELVVHQSSDIRDAANIYARLIDNAAEGDAIWILQDGSYVNSAIFSLLLDAAWNKNLVVFSSNPMHVKHGALFAVYPDNKNMGASLGKLANKVLAGEAELGMQTLKDTFLAVNERTSNHLGISLSKDVKENIDLLMPAR